jgi:S-adenosylmethionine:tRNA ribosyltransferase-isomerase
MRVDLFDFHLPETSIALRPAVPRDAARLLVVTPSELGGAPALLDRHVYDLPQQLRAGDCLVFNDTRVIPAALDGIRLRIGGTGLTANVAFTLIKRVDASTWRAFARPAKRLVPGDTVQFGSVLTATVIGKGDAGEVDLAFDRSASALDASIAAVGVMPLPPYIALKRAPEPSDTADYQTMFAARDGAVAAPTAALHFTPELMAALHARGITYETVTLHVGPGTFLPMKVDDTADHVMHSEWGEISAATAANLNAVRARGGRIIPVGTTSLRLLESAAAQDGTLAPFSGDTAIFITPGTPFKCADGLITNFHLPKSTLLMLVSALTGLDTIQQAYAQAISKGYRFYSYGDACLLWPANP